MKYENEFKEFYDKYSRLYISDKDAIYKYPYQNYPLYYSYIVQPREKYKEAFAPASRFNQDRLTDKIGYENGKIFPYMEYRKFTPYSRPSDNHALISTPMQGSNTEFNTMNYYQNTPKVKLTDSNYRYHYDDIRDKQERRNRELYPQHIVDFTAQSTQETPGRNLAPPFQNYLYTNVIYINRLCAYRTILISHYRLLNRELFKSKLYLPILVSDYLFYIYSYFNIDTEKIGGYSPTDIMSNPIVYPLNTYRNMTKRFYHATPFGRVGSAIIQ